MKDKKKLTIIIIVAISIVVLLFIIMSVSFKEDTIDELKYSQIEYSVPDEFSPSDDMTYSKYYSYSDNSAYCYLSIYSYEKEYYGEFEEWFKNQISFNLNDKVSDLKTLNINGNNVYYIDRLRSQTTNYYYGFSSSNYYYFFDYEITDYKNGDREDIKTNLCFNTIDKVISSVKLK